MANSLSIESGALAVPEPDASGVRVYKGIPYAAPPIGRLRWRPPEPAAAWTGVRPTREFGAHSVQGVVWDDIDLSGAATSEDCLHLNVWTPAAPSDGARLPVMVWIHGGGFVVGSGAEPRYDGARLAARGIVVVTVNHRLNALGFLAHPELTAESEHHSSGAYGFLDLVAALQWVQRNVAAFGGDPDKVTIAGESAGSQATSALMASPLAKGLFARVIGESGAMFASPSRALATLEEAEAAGLGFMRRLGARSLAEMRALPADAILAAAPGLGFRPIIDGWFLPRSPAEIFAAGEHSDVPLMAGWNKDEGFNFTLHQGDDAKRPYVDLARAIFGERTARSCSTIRADRLRPTPPRRARSAATSSSSTQPGPGSRRRSKAAAPRFSASVSTARLSRRRAGLANATIATPAPSMRASSSMCSTISTRFRGCMKTPIASWRNWRRATGSISSPTAIPMVPTCRIGRPTAARAVP